MGVNVGKEKRFDSLRRRILLLLPHLVLLEVFRQEFLLLFLSFSELEADNLALRWSLIFDSIEVNSLEERVPYNLINILSS